MRFLSSLFFLVKKVGLPDLTLLDSFLLNFYVIKYELTPFLVSFVGSGRLNFANSIDYFAGFNTMSVIFIFPEYKLSLIRGVLLYSLIL